MHGKWVEARHYWWFYIVKLLTRPTPSLAALSLMMRRWGRKYYDITLDTVDYCLELDPE